MGAIVTNMDAVQDPIVGWVDAVAAANLRDVAADGIARWNSVAAAAGQ